MDKNRVTLKMIAEEAHVSPSLVSNILNGKGHASQRVRETVGKLLEKNGFLPRNHQRPVIFIAREEPGSSFQSQILLSLLSGFSSVFSGLQIQLQLEISEHFSLNQLNHLFERKPAGVIVLTGSELHRDVVHLGEKWNVPVIQTGYDDELADANAVVVDSYNGAYRSISWLIRKGCRRIALIRWDCSGNSRKKYAGYLNALSDSGIPFDERLVYTAPASRSMVEGNIMLGRYALTKILEQCGDAPPDALAVGNGFLSPSLMYPSAGDSGVIPKFIADLPVVHFEDIPFDNLTYIVSGMLGYPSPGGMRIHVDWKQIGCSAAMMMTQLLSNGRRRLQPQTIRIEPVLEEN